MSTPSPTHALTDADLTLVADIGGTNTRVGMARAGQVLRDTIRRYANADFNQPEAVLRAYLQDHPPPPPAAAAVAIAGTVVNGVADMTNLGWQLSEDDLQGLSGATRVRVLNDLQAQGYALDHLAPAARVQIIAARPALAHATRLVVGLGTGFNACPVFSTASGLFVPPSEAGHCHLPLVSDTERALGAHLVRGNGATRIEELLSGPGLARAYQFFAPEAPHMRPADVTAAVETDPSAARTMQVFIHLLARVMADLALVHLPFGGIFLVGGVSRAIAPYLKPETFGKTFREHGEFLDLVDDFPVYLIKDDYAALTGCARVLQG